MFRCLTLLAVFSSSLQDLTATQQQFCTQNDNGDSWKYDLTPLGQSSIPFVTSDKKWEYHIALCGEQNIPVRPDIAGDAIVQTSRLQDENDPEVHVVGTKIIARHGGEMWVNLVFGGGTPYRTHCNKTERKAQILFVCDPNAGQGKPKLLDEANDDESFCFYMFEWGTSLVCPENAKGPGDHGHVNVLKLIFIELIVITVVYMVLGIGYRRFVLGARGIEQIPNLVFWKNCKDGIAATVDKCKGTSHSLIEGVRSDDHLLPTSGTLDINNMDDDDDERLIIQ